MLAFALASIHLSSVVLVAHGRMRNSRAQLCVSSFLNVMCDIFDQAFGKVLCLLGRNPQYIKLLREEVDRVVHEFG